MRRVRFSRGLESLETLAQTPTKKASLKRLKELGLPDKKREEYQYFDIESLLNREWEIVEPSSAGEIKESNKIVIIDGVVTEICEGVKIGCSNTVAIEKEHFDPLYYLSHTLCGDVISLQFSKDIKVKIEHHFTKQERLLAYRVALYIDPNSHVIIEESFYSSGATGAFIISGYDAFISRDSSLNLIKSETLEDYTPINSHSFIIDKNSSMSWRSFDFGDGSGLQLAQARLKKRASINSSHLLFATKEANRGTISKFIHEGENSNSNQVAKSVLQDKSKGIFDALIKVENSAKYAIAHQNSKAILLNDGAYMASKPQLEIYIDELEASHGSTTGQLDKKALFYLRSRGISQNDARKMLILAFANELIEQIESDEVKASIYRDFETFYYGKTKIECIESCHNCEEMILK
jgi:Fe-S cluster assembly protein SufD